MLDSEALRRIADVRAQGGRRSFATRQFLQQVLFAGPQPAGANGGQRAVFFLDLLASVSDGGRAP